MARTLTVITEVERGRKSDIVKPEELIDIRPARGKQLGLAARKAFNMMLKEAGSRVGEPVRHRILKKTLRQGHKANDHLNEVLQELASTTVEIRTKSSRGRDAIAMPQLVKIIAETGDEDSAWIEYEFDVDLRKIVVESEVYAALKAQAVLAIRSKYSLVLYELGAKMMRMRQPSAVLEVNDFRSMLGVPEGALTEFAQFNRRVLQAAKSEIDQLADFTFEYKVRRDGRTPVAVEVSFWPKSGDLAEAAVLEADRHSAGRRARREGAVERVEPVPAALPSPPPAKRPSRGLAALEPLPGVDHERLRAWVKSSKSVAAAMATIAEARAAEAAEPGAAARAMAAAFDDA